MSGRDGGGSASGANTPHERSDEEDAGFFHQANTTISPTRVSRPKSMAMAVGRRGKRQVTPDDIRRWADESGMGRGKRADGLGDEPEEDEGEQEELTHAEDLELDEDLELAEKEDKGLRGSVY